MSTADILTGLDGKMYISATAGTAATSADTEAVNLKDVTVNMEQATADATRRASGKYRSKKPTLKEMKIEGTLVNVKGATDVPIFISAWNGGTPIAVLCLDEESGDGPDGDFYVTNASRSEPNEDCQTFSVTLEACDVHRAPTWHGGT